MGPMIVLRRIAHTPVIKPSSLTYEVELYPISMIKRPISPRATIAEPRRRAESKVAWDLWVLLVEGEGPCSVSSVSLARRDGCGSDFLSLVNMCVNTSHRGTQIPTMSYLD